MKVEYEVLGNISCLRVFVERSDGGNGKKREAVVKRAK